MACADVETAVQSACNATWHAGALLVLIEKMRYSEPLHYCFAPTEKKQRELITLTVDAPVFV